MSCLVNSNRASLLVGNDFGSLLEPAYDAVDSVHKVLSLYGLLFMSGGNKGGLVADVSDIGTREARSLS